MKNLFPKGAKFIFHRNQGIGRSGCVFALQQWHNFGWGGGMGARAPPQSAVKKKLLIACISC